MAFRQLNRKNRAVGIAGALAINALLIAGLLSLSSGILPLKSVPGLAVFGRFAISRTIRRMNRQEFVYFTKGDDLSVLNRVMMYVQANEITKRIKIVSITKSGEHIREEFRKDIDVLDRAYPDIKIEFIEMDGVFGPELVHRLSA